MSTPVIVAIQRTDKFRMFRANGKGATEVGYLVTGPIPDDAAIALALGITQLLDSTALPVEARESGGSATPALPSGAAAAVLPPGTTYTADAEGTGALIAAHPGLTCRELAIVAGVHLATISKRLTRSVSAGTVTRKGKRYYPPDRQRTGHNPNRRGNIATTGVNTEDFVAYVKEHPGLTRNELVEQLGYTKRQTIHNRVAIARKWDTIRVDSEDRIWPTS